MTTVADTHTDYSPSPELTLAMLRDMVMWQRSIIDRLMDDCISLHSDVAALRDVDAKLRHDLDALRARVYGKYNHE